MFGDTLQMVSLAFCASERVISVGNMYSNIALVVTFIGDLQYMVMHFFYGHFYNNSFLQNNIVVAINFVTSIYLERTCACCVLYLNGDSFPWVQDVPE